jgi:hypothetical protein
MSEISIAKPASLARIDDGVWKQLSATQRREAIERQQRINEQAQKPPAPAVASATVKAPTDPKVAALLLRIKTDREWIAALKAVWESYFPDFEIPLDSQFQIWINRYHDYDRVVYGMESALDWLTEKSEHAHKKKFEEYPNKVTQESLRAYISGCMKKPKKAEDEQS